MNVSHSVGVRVCVCVLNGKQRAPILAVKIALGGNLSQKRDYQGGQLHRSLYTAQPVASSP